MVPNDESNRSRSRTTDTKVVLGLEQKNWVHTGPVGNKLPQQAYCSTFVSTSLGPSIRPAYP